MKTNVVYNIDAAIGLEKIPNNSIDLTVTSPPYDNLRDYKGFTFDFEKIAPELYRVTKPGGVVVWVVGDETKNGSETGTSFRQALYFMECGFNLHSTMIYEKKECPFPSKVRYYSTFEYMFVISKGAPKTIHLIKDKINKKGGDAIISGTNRIKDGTLQPIKSNQNKTINVYGVRTNVWKYGTGNGKTTLDSCAFEHPAIFPEKLAKDHIISWSNEGDIVLDPFAGSGTTLKMAFVLKREFIGFEIAREYCDIIQKRLDPHMNNLYEHYGNLIY